MENLEPKHKKALLVGALVGTVLGAGAAWLMTQTPVERDADKISKPISSGDILKLVGSAATLLKMVDEFRRRL